MRKQEHILTGYNYARLLVFEVLTTMSSHADASKKCRYKYTIHAATLIIKHKTCTVVESSLIYAMNNSYFVNPEPTKFTYI